MESDRRKIEETYLKAVDIGYSYRLAKKMEEFKSNPVLGYRTAGSKAEFDTGTVDYAVFTSASTVRGFAQAVKGIDFSKVKAVCIGRQTKAAADELGMETYMAEQATMDSVVSCVEKLCRER